jgi:hypothetical protein
MKWLDWLIIAAIVGLILLPRRFDPAMRLKEWIERGYRPNGGKAAPTKPPRGGSTGAKQ